MWKEDMRMANLWRVVDALSPDLPLLATSPAPHTKQGDNFEGEKTTETDGADDDGIGALVQKLAYMAGRSGMPFTHGPMTMVVAYLDLRGLLFRPRQTNNLRSVVPLPFGVPVQGGKFAQPKQKFFTAAGIKSTLRAPSTRGTETLRGGSSSTASEVILPTNNASSSRFGLMKTLLFWQRNRSSSRGNSSEVD
ncbi:hypothetical protein NQ176_g6714 [Zarea fungicola]|uniref:Uncharacterized protein n=1 Tax=Zarea fungicola TaxID=93591 RepID=A0ACC1N482_9HYPO|nr:hypothetical protein NQ176_g6714 [Lecanicillium fungicola]